MIERLASHLVAGVMHAVSEDNLGAEQYRQPIRVGLNPTSKSFDRGFRATAFAEMWEWMVYTRGCTGA